jgi:hypothetical protein
MSLKVVAWSLTFIALAVAMASACSSNATKPADAGSTVSTSPKTSTDLITQVAVYAPWGSSGELTGVTVSKQQSGSCFTASIAASGRTDAWRCGVGDEIRDPCFIDPGGSQVACPDLPVLSTVELIHLNTPVDSSLANHENVAAAPWMLQIRGGINCAFVTGATGVVAGQRLNYSCADGSSLYGTPDRSMPQWTILRGTNASAEQTPVAIAKSWS